MFVEKETVAFGKDIKSFTVIDNGIYAVGIYGTAVHLDILDYLNITEYNLNDSFIKDNFMFYISYGNVYIVKKMEKSETYFSKSNDNLTVSKSHLYVNGEDKGKIIKQIDTGKFYAGSPFAFDKYVLIPIMNNKEIIVLTYQK